MGDFKLIETGDGGDIVISGNDVVIINGLQNMPYLAMFGGNPNGVTPDERVENEESLDWWGNDLFMQNDRSLQFNSLLEQRLKEVSLTSSGRLALINVINQDLNFMRDFADVSVSATIVSDDRIDITIKLDQPGNLESNEFTYIWDSTKNELIFGTANSSSEGQGVPLNNALNFGL